MDADTKAYLDSLIGDVKGSIDDLTAKVDGIIQNGVPKATIVTSAPSATPRASSAGPNAGWVVATNTIIPAAPTHTKCSAEGLRLAATKLTPALTSAASPTAPPTTVNAFPVDAASSAVVVEVAAPTCLTSKQDTHFPSGSVTTVALPQEGVSELVLVQGKHHGSSSPTSIELATLDVDPSALTAFINTVHVTCSMDCLPKLAMAVPLLDASSSLNPYEYGLNADNVRVAALPQSITGVLPAVSAPVFLAPTIQLQLGYDDSGFFRLDSSWRVTSKVLVNRPMPWPSFTGVHANGVETRPLPWSSFVQLPEACASLHQGHRFKEFSGHCPQTVVSACRATVTLVVVVRSHNNGLTSARRTVDREEQFCSLGAGWIVLEKFLKKPGTESQGSARELLAEAASGLAIGTCCFLGTFYQDSSNKLMSEDDIHYGPDHIRWEIAWFLVALSCDHTYIEGSGNFTMSDTPSSSLPPTKLPDATCCLLMDHHSRQGFVILGVLVTWPYFSMDKFTDLSSKAINFQTDAVSSANKLRLQSYSSFSTWISFGVGSWNDILLQDWLHSWYNGQITQCGFELLHCQIELSLHWECSELASTEFKTSLLPNVVFFVPVDGQTRPTAVCTAELRGIGGDMETIPFIEALLQFSFSLAAKEPLHSSVACSLKPSIQWVTASDLEETAATSAPDAHATAWKTLKSSSFILIPAGFGDRGISRHIWAANIAPENKFPGVGICLRMQLSVIELYILVLRLEVANTEELSAYTPDRVVLYMPEVPVILLPELWSQSGKTIILIWSWDPGIKELLGLSKCLRRAALLSAHCADEDGMVARKQYRILVQRMMVPWNLGGSTWSQWFLTCYDQAPFQGGRYYREGYCMNPNELYEVHAPWDPGKLALDILERGFGLGTSRIVRREDC